MKKWIAVLGCLGIIVLVVLICGMIVAASYNKLNTLDQAVRASA